MDEESIDQEEAFWSKMRLALKRRDEHPKKMEKARKRELEYLASSKLEKATNDLWVTSGLDEKTSEYLVEVAKRELGINKRGCIHTGW